MPASTRTQAAPGTAPATTPAASRRQGWLSIGPASRLLGVDPDTLRRWADEGRVEAYLTPGGHRRFDRGSLERLVAVRRGGARPPFSGLGATPERLSRAYQRSYASARTEARGSVSGVPPARQLDAPDREAFRDDGRRLVLAVFAYLDAGDAAGRARAEAEAVLLIDEVARRLVAAGTDLTGAVTQLVAARRPLLAEIGGLAARRALDPAALSGLYQDASGLLDRLLLRLVATHQTATSGAAMARAAAESTATGLPGTLPPLRHAPKMPGQ